MEVITQAWGQWDKAVSDTTFAVLKVCPPPRDARAIPPIRHYPSGGHLPHSVPPRASTSTATLTRPERSTPLRRRSIGRCIPSTP